MSVLLAWPPLAQEAGGSARLIEDILKYGVTPVILIILAMTGWVAFKPEISRLLSEIQRQHQQIDSLVAVYEDKVIPLLTEANRTLSKLADDERRRRERWERWEEEDGPGDAPGPASSSGRPPGGRPRR